MMRNILAALATLVTVACSGGEERKPSDSPPTTATAAPTAGKVDPPADAAAPPADAAPALAPELVVTIAADGKTFLGDKEVAAADLAAELAKMAAKTRALVIAPDQKVPHKRVVEIMELAKKAGFEKMAIKTDAAP